MTKSADSTTRRIVVGVDGSPASAAALRWAVHEGEITGDTVEAVIAWHYPIAAGGYGWAPMVVEYDLDLRPIAEKALTEAIDKAAGPDPGVTIERRVAEGDASTVLTGASADADLLVVGSRGHGTFTDALIGSVSQNCAHHAKCPVVIVRGGNSAPAARDESP
ncbi:MAG TPA: universal stress protein [Streptosporangiaceae bacterium]|jgi:nucleotide-binding universal stress UspA family protein